MREPEPAAGISAKKFVILVMEAAQADLMGVVKDKVCGSSIAEDLTPIGQMPWSQILQRL